jgi:DNA-directed RNA polymerase I subunit RPA2
LEIALILKKEIPAQYPGLFLFTNACRMMRPVINLVAQKIEFIGTFEQICMDICVISEEAREVNIYNIYMTYFLFSMIK